MGDYTRNFHVDNAKVFALVASSMTMQISEEPAQPEMQKVSNNDELTILNNSLSELENEKNELLSQVDSLKTKIDEQAKEIYDLNTSKAQLLLSSAFYENKAKTNEDSNELITTIRHLIHTPNECSYVEMLKALEVLHGNDVIVMPRAYASAEESKYPDRDTVWNALLKLVGEYRNAILNGTPDSEARKAFPVSVFAANESESISTNTKKMQLRKAVVNGEEHTFEKHLRFGVSRGSTGTMRIYFKVVGNQLVILHCGEHF